MRDPDEDDSGDGAKRNACGYDGHGVDADTADGNVERNTERQ